MTYQQINLYQPIFRKQEKVFSAKTMLQSAAVVLAGLIAFFAYGMVQTAALEAELVHVEERSAESQRRLQTTQRLYPERGQSAELESEVQRLTRELEMRQRVMARVGERGAGNTEGFSAHLEGLARQRPAPLWLTAVDIREGGTELRLAGSSLQPEAVPRYLQRLSQERVFAGTEFRHFEIARPEKQPNRVDFIIQTDLPRKEDKP